MMGKKASLAISELLNGELIERNARVDRKLNEMPPKYRKSFCRAVDGLASPRDAIKSFCLECIGWETGEISRCTCYACPLWAYRPVREV